MKLDRPIRNPRDFPEELLRACLCLTLPLTSRCVYVCVPEARCTGERCPSRQEEEEEAALVQQGQEALTKALAILEDKRGWKTEISEVIDNNNNNNNIIILYLIF